MAKRDGKTGRVGYCNPPIETRFRTGVSGNPQGRPRRADRHGDLSELSRLLHDNVRVSVAGKVKTLKYIDIILREKMKAALAGDLQAALDLLQAHRRERRRHAPRFRWLDFPSIIVVPTTTAPHVFVNWSDLYGGAKRAGLVAADPRGRRMVKPGYLKRELAVQAKRKGQVDASDMDKAVARLFSARVPVVQNGVTSRVPLSKALYLQLMTAGAKKSKPWKAIDKMQEEDNANKASDAAETKAAEHGILVVAQAPRTVEEWTRLYGKKAGGEWNRERQQDAFGPVPGARNEWRPS